MNQDPHAEAILMQQVACRLVRGANLMGGTMVLTARTLIFEPIIGHSALKSSSRTARLSQHVHHWHLHPQKLLNMAIMPLTKPIDIPLDHITDIAPTRRCALRIAWLESATPRSMEFTIAATRLSTIWNPENVVCRDELLAAVNDARERNPDT